MSRKIKEFKSGSNIIELITSRKDSLGRKDDVSISWSCSGRVSIDEARHFKNKLAKVIAKAKCQQFNLED